MIDASYTGKAPSSDASTYSGASSATNKAGQGDRGFYETLSNVGQNNRKPAPSNADTQGRGDTAGNADDAANQQGVADNSDTTETKPLIDIRQRPAQSAANVAHTGANLWQKSDKATVNTGEETKGEVKTVGKDAANSGKPSAAGEAAPAHVTTASLAKVMADGKQVVAGGKTDKTNTDDAETEADATDGATTELDDVLNLLSSDLAAAGSPAASASLAAGEVHLKGTAQIAGAKGDEATSALASALDGGNGVTDEASGDGQVRSQDTDRNVRFVRADGKSMTMRTGAGRGDEGADAVDNSARQATSTIEVVDARRFLAPTASSNSNNVLATMVGNSEWTGAMRPGSELSNAASQTSTGNVVNTLKIKMHPIDLGSVTATLRLNGDVLTVELTVENSAAYRQLSDDQSDMVNSLRAQGYAVDQVQVTMSSVSRPAADGSQAPGTQQQTQQQMQQSGGQGNGAGNQRQGATPDMLGGTGLSGVTVDEATAPQASGNGSARPDHVYI
ncbi:MAG: flagellar hook-length control protein FliK [Allorhizobium sp.]